LYGSLQALNGGQRPRAAGQKGGLGFRRHIPAVLFLLGLVIILIALARPHMSDYRALSTVILVFDVCQHGR
jgi:hypothetical protein